MYQSDTGAACGGGVLKMCRFSVYEYIALVRTIYSGKNVHKGALSGAVFADYGVYCTFFDSKVNFIVCDEAPEKF